MKNETLANFPAAIKKALAQSEQEPVEKLKTSNVLLRCHRCGYSDKLTMQIEYTTPPQRKQEFIKYEVENADDWSEWVCPNPDSYLMKCCDCGLVHEAEFGVVRYKSETEREYCDFVDDPNLQAVFRMRRSEQRSPEDTAHRAGGLPMEQSPQRTWVGLTEQEQGAIMEDLNAHGTNLYPFAQAIEAKLKEKNT